MDKRIARYPLSGLYKDYGRAILGLGFVLAILLNADLAQGMQWLFVGIASLFLIFLGRTIWYQLERVEFGPDYVIQSVPFRSIRLAWKDLLTVRLRYWGSRRKKDGMLHLFLSDGRKSISIHNGLSDFMELAIRAIHVAKEKRLALDDITEDNLQALERSWGDHEAIIDGTRS